MFIALVLLPGNAKLVSYESGTSFVASLARLSDTLFQEGLRGQGPSVVILMLRLSRHLISILTVRSVKNLMQPK